MDGKYLSKKISSIKWISRKFTLLYFSARLSNKSNIYTIQITNKIKVKKYKFTYQISFSSTLSVISTISNISTPSFIRWIVVLNTEAFFFSQLKFFSIFSLPHFFIFLLRQGLHSKWVYLYIMCRKVCFSMFSISYVPNFLIHTHILTVRTKWDDEGKSESVWKWNGYTI